jgi:peptidoglycan/LPS O-acetylase OafA/YrhL
MVVLVLLLLLAAALGILGAVIKVALVLVLSVIFAVVILGAIAYYSIRHRFRRFMRDAQRRGDIPPRRPGSGERGYPTTGEKRPGPSLPE